MAKYLVQHRRGTTSQWANNTTMIPLEGEIVIELDEENGLHKLKIGDGVHSYAELAYLMAGDEIVTQVLAETKPRIVTVEFPLNWTKDNDNKYSQTLTLDGITKNSRLDLQPTAEMLAEFKQLGLVFVTENNGGTITVYSVGNMPTKAYTIQATIIETECDGQDIPVVGIPVGSPVTQPDWNQTDETQADYIKNKPTSNDVYADATINGAQVSQAYKYVGACSSINYVDHWYKLADSDNWLTASGVGIMGSGGVYHYTVNNYPIIIWNTFPSSSTYNFANYGYSDRYVSEIKLPQSGVYMLVKGIAPALTEVRMPNNPPTEHIIIDGVRLQSPTRVTHFGTCSTGASIAAKTVSISNFVQMTGARAIVRFTNGNTVANPTLNISNTGAKPIYYKNAAITADTPFDANSIYEFVYDGIQYELIGHLCVGGSVAPFGVGTVDEDGALSLSMDDINIVNGTKLTFYVSSIADGATNQSADVHINSTLQTGTLVNNATGEQLSGKYLLADRMYEAVFYNDDWFLLSGPITT